MKKKKDILIIVVFSVIIFGLSIAHLALPDQLKSSSERRKLATLPEISLNAVMSSEFSDDLETYLLDQFPLRESFRTVNAITRFYVFQQKDSNDIWLADGHVFKTEYPLNEGQVKYAAGLINRIANTYLEGSQVYYSIIPDKSYFAAEENGYPAIDYDRMVELMNQGVTEASYIDIFDTLTIDDYYRTDAHWSQDRILSTAERLAEGMGVSDVLASPEEYEAHSLYPFYGVYMGQAALPVKPDTLIYLTSPYTESSSVTGLEDTEAPTVYAPDRITNTDGYDVFLSGAQAFLTIECPNAETDRELVIFRDSFGSSIAPLLLGAYSRITLIDLRYFSSKLLPNYITFDGQDVLFLYSTTILNSASLLK